MIRGRKEGKSYATWFIGFDNEIDNSLFSPPPPLGQISARQTNGTSFNDNDASPDTSLESIQTQTTPVAQPRTATTPTQTIENLDAKELDKRDIYKEAFESTKRTEEAKFKVRFDNLLQEMQQSFDTLSPRDGQVPPGYGSTSYGDVMSTYRGRVKDLLVSLSQRLELAVESFDESCAHNASLTSQKVRQMISKLIEDRLGESLDLTSDEAVSDLSSLSDDSGEQKSLEDQIAQAVIARVLELHRNQNGVHLELGEPADDRRNSDSSGSDVKTVVRSRGSSMSEEPNANEMVPNEHISHKRSNRLEKSDRNNDESDINANINDRSKWVKRDEHRNYKNDEDDDIDGERKISERLSPGEKYEVFDDEGGEYTHRDKRKRLSSGDSELGSQRYRSSAGYSESGQERHNSGPGEFGTRKHGSGSENTESDKQRPRLGSGISEDNDGKKDMVILKEEFEKLRTFAREIVPRPLYEEAKFVEEVEPEPIEESMEYVTIDHEESQDEFSSRFFTYDKVRDSGNRGLPDFSDLDYEYHDFGVNEIDPDLLSMNLAPILEETEEELAEESEEGEYEQDWRGNWIFKGASGMAPYNNISGKNRISGEFGDGYVMVPKPNEIFAPQIGNRDVDDMSDLSENEDADLSDEENSFYARTSEEIARITRKSSSSNHPSALANMSMLTDGESDAESIASRPTSSSFSDSGIRSKPDQYSFDSRVSERSVSVPKLSEDLVRADGDDPKFEIPPDSVTISEGEPAKLSCRVAGTQPLDVFWYKVTEEVQELENSEYYEIIKDGSRQSMNMYNMTKADACQYMCVAINENGRCCQYFILHVKKNTMELKAPEFLKNLADVDVKEGQSVKFRCKVKGIPQPRIVWYKDGQILMNQLNYKLERFGNRDYILAIDSATMDEDAEYCAHAKNLAGEVRSSAQLIVEPNYKPESVPVTAKSPKQVEKKTSGTEFPDLSYLGIGRSKASSTKTAKSSSPSSGRIPKSPKDKNDESGLHNLSEKVAKTKDSVSDVAEDMLSSSRERDAAENVRKATTSTLDYLNNTDAYMLREKGVGDVATSTPRSSLTERIFNPDSDGSHITCDTSAVTIETTLNTSNDLHKSEMKFDFNPMTINMGSAKDSKSKPGRRTLSRSSSSNEDTSVATGNRNPLHNDTLQTDRQKSGDVSPITKSPFISMETPDMNNTLNSADSSSEYLTVNLGPKKENKEPYQRDFYINASPQMQRKTPEQSPREENHAVHTEEKIYLAGNTVTPLENKVQTLHDKMRAVNALQEKDRKRQLESDVAQSVAPTASNVKQVKHIEKSVPKLADPPKGKIPSTKSRQAPSVPQPRPITPPREKPQPTFLIGDTKEQDLPESRTEFNEEYGPIELPSVNRLKAMFGGFKSDDKDSSIKRDQESLIHSITARSVPKEQLEKLRQTTDDDPRARVAMPTALSEPVQPGRATALMTGQPIKATPAMPKQVYQSRGFTEPASVKMQVPKQSIQVSSITKKTPEAKNGAKSQSTMKISLGSGIINRPLSPACRDPVQPVQPIKSPVTRVPEPISQSNTPTQKVKTGGEIDTPDERKSPKIKSGAISAMSKFWENKGQGTKDGAAPELLEYD